MTARPPEVPLHIRRAVEADANDIATLHARAWQWAYRGQVPAAYLDGLTAKVEQRAAWWRDRLRRSPSDQRTWVAERGGSIVGFVSAGPSRDADAKLGTGEVYAIYLDLSIVGRGIGRILFDRAVGDLEDSGFHTATLWVLTTNDRARLFYEKAGWSPDGTTKTEDRPEFTLHETRYSLALSPSLGGEAGSL